MAQIHITVSCHCGSARQELATPNIVSSTTVPNSAPSPLTLCHCTTCRHVTGQLMTSYQSVTAVPDLAKATAFSASPRDTRYFCTTCGCHIFRRTTDDPNQDAGDGTEKWAVATGTIVSDTAPSNGNASGSGCLLGEFASHSHVQDTGKDGGLSTFLPNLEHAPTLSPHSAPPPQPLPPPSTLPAGTLPASCHCTLVTLYITPPTPASRTPKSPLADLIIPFHTGSPLIPNDADDKWWLRPSPFTGQTKYLAGTCACASCRLISGFEIQSWTFIPRVNILIREQGQGGPGSVVPLDFGRIPASTLGVYESSPGVSRNFCPRCGATVFWHDTGRPELIDVSVGLLWGESGPRAEELLMWWGNRVSFSEEAGTGREGEAKARAQKLVHALEEGIMGWKGEKAS